MADVDKALETQLKNISELTGRSMEELFDLIEKSGLEKHGQIRKFAQTEFELTYGHANMLAQVYRRRDEEPVPLDTRVDEIYSGKKAELRPIHDKFMKLVARFGDFEIAPKKTYLSLRRKKQFAMVGPATNTRVEIGLNANRLSGDERLIEMKAGSMCPYVVKITDPDQVDDQLISWVRAAYDESA